MAKIAIVSDLHLEFRPTTFTLDMIQKINETECDLVVVAGDTHQNTEYRKFFFDQITHPLRFCLGNHDYYGNEWFDDYEDKDGIITCALWTNFGNNPLVEMEANGSINDFHPYKGIKKWNVNKCMSIHQEHLDKIFESKSKIVVTHFAPSLKSSSSIFKGSSLNPYFCNDLDSKIANSDKKLWIHGHVHNCNDYMIGDCRIFSNPLGYPNEKIRLGEEPWKIKIIEI